LRKERNTMRLPLLILTRLACLTMVAAAVGAMPLAVHARGPANTAGSGGGGGSGGGNNGGGAGGGANAAADAEVPGEILLKLRSTSALQPLLAKYPVTLLSRFGARPIYRVKAVGNADVKQLLLSLSAEPEVMIAESNGTHRSPEARRNQPWAIGTEGDYVAQWAPTAMNLARAHQTTTGAGVRVAVLDTGVDTTHPLLAGRLLPGHDFVDDDKDPSEMGSRTNPAFGHGTHVAGLVAMVAPAAKIMPLRILDADGMGNVWVLAEALLFAMDPDGNPNTDDGAHVINLSLGTLTRTRLMDSIALIASCGSEVADDPIADRTDPGYADDRARCAKGFGAVVVAAAGNEGSANVKEYPAAEGAYGLLAVAASTSAKKLALFSNSGSWVQLAAPGEGITSAVPGGYGTWSGTSMASPLAAGTVALVRSLNLGMAPKDVIDRVKRSSVQLCGGTQLRQLDAAAAVNNSTPAAWVCP
jgi:subtilisin family serine protease